MSVLCRTRKGHFSYITSHSRNFSEVWGSLPFPLNLCVLIDPCEHWEILCVNQAFLIHILKILSLFLFPNGVFSEVLDTHVWICCAFGRWVEKLLVTKSLTTSQSEVLIMVTVSVGGRLQRVLAETWEIFWEWAGTSLFLPSFILPL